MKRQKSLGEGVYIVYSTLTVPFVPCATNISAMQRAWFRLVQNYEAARKMQHKVKVRV